jgi:small subunit ribosomal protein S13
MARIAGVDLPKEKHVVVALEYIYGVGPFIAKQICSGAKVNPDTSVEKLSEDEIVRIREEIKKYAVEGDLRREVTLNIKRLIDIGAYRGSRHRRNLPVRGQRTKTNARTRRGKRKTVGGAKVKDEKAAAKA